MAAWLIIVLSLVEVCLADHMIWQKDTNFDNPNNWNGGGVICKNDRKVFPADMVASVYIQKNESLQELVLSKNMMLTIKEGVAITFSQDATTVSAGPPVVAQSVSSQTTEKPVNTNCVLKGRVLEFTAKASSWFDPSSWSTNAKDLNNTQRFKLDVEKIPCSRDAVKFPSVNSFQVDVEQQSLHAASIMIRSQEIDSQAAFQKYWDGDRAKYDFINRAATNVITGETCQDGKQCSCLERYTNAMKARVCKYAKSELDVSNLCKQPLLIRGQCNQLCGAKVTLSFAGTSEEDYNQLVSSSIHEEIIKGLTNSPTVQYAVGPYVNQSIDIILKDDDDQTGKLASKSVCDLLLQMKHNSSSFTLGVTNFTFERSDGIDSCFVPPPSHTSTQAKKFDYVILGVALAIGLICILLVIIGVALYKRRYQTQLKTEMELGDISRTSTQGFDNPVYDTPIPYDDSFMITYETDNDQLHGFENAMFSPGVDVLDSKSEIAKKSPLGDEYTPVEKKPKKKSGKKSKESKNLGFDNPVYDIKDNDNTGSMVSVSLEEDDVVVPKEVKYDGTGFVNPIATGLSEETAPDSVQPEKKKTTATAKPSNGFENPLYKEPATSEDKVDGVNNDTIVHVAQPTKKKKHRKGKKKNKDLDEAGEDNGDLGFGNPMYNVDDASDFYQPTTPGLDDERLTPDE